MLHARRHPIMLGTPLDVGPGKPLVREGETMREVLVLLDGRADETFAGRPVASIDAPVVLGGDPMGRSRRSRGVTTTSDCVVVVFTPREWSTLLHDVKALCPTDAAVLRLVVDAGSRRHVTRQTLPHIAPVAGLFH